MKKIFTLILGITLVYSCSTSSDGNTTVVPITPSNLTGTVASTTQINLSWTDNSTNETGFKIERKIGSGTYAVVGTTATDVSTFNDTGLAPSTTYTYRVYSYNAGGNSPAYSNELTLTTTSNSSIVDINGNSYPLVTIGNQVWTKTNLNVSTYRDGTPIPQVPLSQWASFRRGAWCYYNNDPANGAIYGKLYNWYAIAGIYNDSSLLNVSLRKQFAPTGWHVPSDIEWGILINNLDPNSMGGAIQDNVAGGKMKETGTVHWLAPNTNATNTSDFTGLPGGYCLINGVFIGIGRDGAWWSTDEFTPDYAWYRNLSYYYGNAYVNNATKYNGLSVRCVKD